MINVYICHPYTADPDGNVAKVEKLVEQFAGESISKMTELDSCYQDLAEYDLVYVPISPMLVFPKFMSEPAGIKRDHAMAFCLSLLHACDEIWVCSREISDGMADEISYAAEHGIKVVWKA